MIKEAEYTIAFIGGKLAKRDYRAGEVEYMENNKPERKSFTGTLNQTNIDLYASSLGQIKGIGKDDSFPSITSTGSLEDFSLRIESSTSFVGQIGTESFRGRVDGNIVTLDRSDKKFTLL